MESINSRIRVTRDTTANWNSHRTFIPLRGEVIVYTDYSQTDDGSGHTVNVPGIKIGDGSAYLIDLPFVGGETLQELRVHSSNTDIHVTQNEKTFCNNKLNCEVNSENLILSRN